MQCNISHGKHGTMAVRCFYLCYVVVLKMRKYFSVHFMYLMKVFSFIIFTLIFLASMQVTRMQENMRLSNKCTEKLTSGGLCASYPTSALSKALGMSNLVDGNSDFLAQSCSARIEGNASQVHDTSSDDELTNLGWLQDNDLLKNMSFTQSKSVVNTTAVKTNAEPENESKDSALAALPYDPYLHSDNKPPYSFSTLIFMAIDQAEGKKLSVKEIYEWIWENFPYYQNAQTGWKNSVRHNLSLNKCFRKVEKDKEGVIYLFFIHVDFFIIF